jgi:hypothetical protein
MFDFIVKALVIVLPLVVFWCGFMAGWLAGRQAATKRAREQFWRWLMSFPSYRDRHTTLFKCGCVIDEGQNAHQISSLECPVCRARKN